MHYPDVCVYVFVCVWEREREREQKQERVIERESCLERHLLPQLPCVSHVLNCLSARSSPYLYRMTTVSKA